MREIITELPMLTRSEIETVDARVHAQLRDVHYASSKPWGEALLELAGTAQGLLEDSAQRHDHYLHGLPK